MYYTVIKHSGHLSTLDKCRKHEPQVSVFYIFLVFSNDHRVLSRCNTWLRLLYLLIKAQVTWYLQGFWWVVEKRSNFKGFSGTNSWKKRLIWHESHISFKYPDMHLLRFRCRSILPVFVNFMGFRLLNWNLWLRDHTKYQKPCI